MQVFSDVLLNLGRGRSRKRNDGELTDVVDNTVDTAILRPEVMPPFRNTVSFVDSYKGYLGLLQEIQVFLLGERLRGNILEFQ